jgi:hypothetical protein
MCGKRVPNWAQGFSSRAFIRRRHAIVVHPGLPDFSKDFTKTMAFACWLTA